jgi:predicted permease
VALDSYWSDVRLAARSAARRPGFTLLVALTLALGLGVNSAVFALVDAILIRPLPFRDPSRLVYVWQTLPKQNVFEVEATPFDFDAWRGLRSFSAIAMTSDGSFTLTGGDAEAERVQGARTTASLMPTLGIAPALGRAFVEVEDDDAAERTVILGNGLWRRRFGGDASVLGRRIEVDGVPRTIVGVMPRGATLPGSIATDTELWLPMNMTPAERANEISHNYTIVARLADGVTPAQADAELLAWSVRMAAERPSHVDMGTRIVSVEERTVRAVRPALVVAAGGVALLLLVAAANASTLLIARAANRRREVAIRAALGAPRRRLLSLSIAESVVFSAIGVAAALPLGRFALSALVPLFASSLPSTAPVAVGAMDAGITAVAGLGLGVAAGLLAAGGRGDAASGALAFDRTMTPPARARVRNALVAAQIALAVVLLSAAALMLESVAKLSHVDPGFTADHLLTFRVSLLGERYASAGARTGFVSDALAALSATPGVRSAAAASVVPFGGFRNATVVHIEGHVEPPGSRTIIDQRYVSPGYFATMGVPMAAGRGFSDTDTDRSERVVIVNRTMARRYFPNEDPVGRRVRTAAGIEAGVWLRIVGIVEDVRHVGLDRDPVPEMYQPIAQTAVSSVTFVTRTVETPAATAPAARSALRRLDANVPLYDVRTMEDRIAASLTQRRAALLTLIATAALAALLAAVAIYGAIWYSVVQRTAEIGIRIALGATRASIFARTVIGALGLASGGAAIGVAIALATGSLLRSLLFETRTTDARAFGAVAASVLAIAACASIVPAVRAMRVDPIVALRDQP